MPPRPRAIEADWAERLKQAHVAAQRGVAERVLPLREAQDNIARAVLALQKAGRMPMEMI